jgi:hypothetical protein
MIIGGIIVVMGVLLLLQNVGIITYNFWSLFWPVVLIIIGIKIAMRKGGHHPWHCCQKQAEEKEQKPQQ